MWRARAWLARIALQALFGAVLLMHQRLRVRIGGELTDPNDTASIEEWGHMHIQDE